MLNELIEKITKLKQPNQTLLVAIDGRGGSGKSTLANKLKEKLENVTIVHLDDFAYPMGGADRQRLLDQVILPLKENRVAKYQKRDFKTKELTSWHEIQPGGIVIIEGVITLHDILEKYYDFKIWIEVPAEIGFERGLKRDKEEYGVDTEKDWKEKWMPEEDKAINEQKPQEKADFIVNERNKMIKKNKLPKVIEEVGFDFHWLEEKVWMLDVPIEEMDIKGLEWHFDIPFWFKPGGYYDLKPKDVLDNPEQYKEEFARTMKADLSYPLDIMWWKNRWLLLDGLHRLVKAKQLGWEKIKVRKIPKKAIPLIQK